MLPEPSRWQPPPGSDAVTQPGGEHEGSRFAGSSVGLSGALHCMGLPRGFCQAPGVGTHLGDGNPPWRWVPVTAADWVP